MKDLFHHFLALAEEKPKVAYVIIISVVTVFVLLILGIVFIVNLWRTTQASNPVGNGTFANFAKEVHQEIHYHQDSSSVPAPSSGVSPTPPPLMPTTQPAPARASTPTPTAWPTHEASFESYETTFAEYGYRLVNVRSFFVEVENQHGYAGPVNQIRMSDLMLLRKGYNIWTCFDFEFTSAQGQDIDSIEVSFEVRAPDGSIVIYEDGQLGDGSRIEYDHCVMPSLLTTYFTKQDRWPLGVYSLRLLLNGQHAGESNIELVDEQYGRHMMIPEYMYLWDATSRAWTRTTNQAPWLYSELGGIEHEPLPVGAVVKIISEPIYYNEEIWYQVQADDASGFLSAFV